MQRRRITTINSTNIKFIRICDSIYAVDKISFLDFSVEAHHTDLTLADVPEEKVFDLADFPEFKVTLHNWHGEVVNIADYLKNRKSAS